MGTMESRKLRVFTDEDIDKVTSTYHSWRNNDVTSSTSSRAQSRGERSNETSQYHNTDGFSYSATLEEVQKQDYKLTPGIYVGTEAVADDGIPFEEKMETLQAQLQEQFVKGDRLQKEILKNFEKF
jgi:type I restriction enzyme M protein